MMKLNEIWFFVVLPVLLFGLPAYGEDSCVQCHKTLDGALSSPINEMANDIHAQRGLSCASCHGGDPVAGLNGNAQAAMNPKKGYLGVPAAKDIPKFCARCHSDGTYMRKYRPDIATDQFAQYQTSRHGALLGKGDKKVAMCVSCHRAHGVRSVKDPLSAVYPTNIPATCGRCHSDSKYMEGYKIPVDQFNKYRQSVHGIALLEKGNRSAPACNNCHGNHGAFPPAVSSISQVCGVCHLNNLELFSKSPHSKAFKQMGLPECESCHGNHEIKKTDDAMLGTESSSNCVSCHDQDSAGYTTAAAMKKAIMQLRTTIEQANTLLVQAEKAGVEVGDTKFIINDAYNDLVKSRAITHSFSVEEVEKITSQGLKLAEQALKEGREALKEVQARRRWLVMVMVIVFAAATLLYLKIREIEKKGQG
jgi:hypothetical protein